MRTRTRGALMLAAAAAALAGCGTEAPEDAGESPGPASAEPSEAHQEQPEEPAPEAEEESGAFTILSAGDVLIHDAIIAAAEQQDGSYDFAEGLSGVEHWVSGADLALCGMEVPIVPPGTEPVGYPVFGAPDELADSLAQTGFHGCTTATNHSLDMGVDGVQHTLDTFDAAGLGHAGTARTEEEAAEPQLYTLERGDREIVVAHVANTQIHNDPFYPPQETPWVVADGDAEEMSAQAEQARADGADLVIASVHWGEEYAHAPNEEQNEYASELAEAGQIDLVFGNHSHTPQPLEQLDGGPDGEGMWVTWSLGNFFTNQDEECCVPETATGIMALAQAEVDDDGARITGLEWSPVTVDREGASRGEETFRGIYPLAELLDGEHEHEIPDEVLEDRWERVVDVMGEDALAAEPPEPTGEAPDVVPRSG
ncbi:CapA family protein [Nesterenkonia populi]|uniref:CapA family protein n=1 Tax=Nesterenkonia populi TaxID=1591087 RepID=UPI0014786F14|nr:CapA family protein [Nesterenkonia populi]